MRWDWWEAAIGVCAILLVTWALLVAILWKTRPDELTAKQALRLLPDLVTVLRRIAAAPNPAAGVRLRLGLLLVYLAFPVDLVPDFIPVIGYADDAVVVLLTLRSVVRRAGRAAVVEHWPASPAGLKAVLQLAGVPSPSTDD